MENAYIEGFDAFMKTQIPEMMEKEKISVKKMNGDGWSLQRWKLI